MSITLIATVHCDLCGQWTGETTGGSAGARRIAKAQGWWRRDGRDLCPACGGRQYGTTPVERAGLLSVNGRLPIPSPDDGWVFGAWPSDTRVTAPDGQRFRLSKDDSNELRWVVDDVEASTP